MTHDISLWLLTYALPALVTFGVLKLLSSQKNPTRDALIIHTGLVVSILASQYALRTLGFLFPWQPHLLSIGLYGACILLSAFLLGIFGMWYALSALLQQLTILSVSFLLFQLMPVPLVILLVVPIFALGHAQETRNRWIRVTAVSFWGTASIVLFRIVPDVYLLAALHTLLGTAGIRRSIVYPASQKDLIYSK